MSVTASVPVEQLDRPDGGSIAYRRHVGKQGYLPGVVFIHGLRSDMDGGKAERLHEFCVARDQSFVRFDCRGHGQSSGKFAESVISDWAEDALLVLDRLTSGPQVVVGSSMGGWLMLLTALGRPERVSGVVGIAAAPDFTQRFLEELSDEEQLTLRREGQIGRPTDYDSEPYVFTQALFDDGRERSVLNNSLPYNGRIRLLHGMQDDAVPWELALDIAAKAITPDVRVHLIKDGDHRLSRESDLLQLCAAVAELSVPSPDQ